MSDRKPPIKFVNRTFQEIRDSEDSFETTHYPDTSLDSSVNAFKSLIKDEIAYLGAQLSFNIDYYVNESFLDSAIEANNILRHAVSRGYKPEPLGSSSGILTFYITIPANDEGTGPNRLYFPMLRQGSEFSSNDGNSYILIEDVNFGDTENEVVVSDVDSTSGAPTAFAIKAYGQCISGELKQEIITIGDFQKFLKVGLRNQRVIEIMKVEDSEGHEYVEVDFLSQDIVYRSIANRDSTTSEQALNILKPIPAPRRFTVIKEGKRTVLQFGHGSSSDIDASEPTDPSNVVLNLIGKRYISDDSFDPFKLISSDKFGIAPANTSLKIVYRANSTDNANAIPGTVKQIVLPILDFGDTSLLSQSVIANIAKSLESDNDYPIIGDSSNMTQDELKSKIRDKYAAQNRAVTRQDYKAMIYNMPSKFGKVKRVNISQSTESAQRKLNIAIVSETRNGTLTRANGVLKSNLKTWINRYKMINDNVDIVDAQIVNFGIKFTAVGEPNVSKSALISKIRTRLAGKFLTKMDIGEPIDIGMIYKEINKVEGVVDTTFVEVFSRHGGIYEPASYNFTLNSSPDGRLIWIPDNSIFELRYPKKDIVGLIR